MICWKECEQANSLVLLSQGEKQGNLIHLKSSANRTVLLLVLVLNST